MSTPESTFYVTGGTLRHDAACYVERQADKDLLDGLLKGEFCYVLTSRQMGKSGLAQRPIRRLRRLSALSSAEFLYQVGQADKLHYEFAMPPMKRRFRILRHDEA